MNIKTEGVKYMWSKKDILPYIFNEIKDLDIKTVLDGFSWTTRVSQFFANNGYNVISNDLNIWWKVFWTCYLHGSKVDKAAVIKKIDHLNSIEWYNWYYTKNYGWIPEDNTQNSVSKKDWKKKIWQVHNTMKLDAIRDEIEKISENEIEKSILLTSLILALDKVDSTLWHQSSFLRNWAKRSYETMVLKYPLIQCSNENTVYNDDVFNILKNVQVDLAYFDPPYGSSNDAMPSSRVRYGMYYHIWWNIIKHDKPETYGSVMKRSDINVESTYSVFEEYKKDDNEIFIAETAIKKLFNETNAKYILFSYNTNSRVPIPNIERIIKDLWYNYIIKYLDYKKNIMSSMTWKNEWDHLSAKDNFEVLILITK